MATTAEHLPAAATAEELAEAERLLSFRLPGLLARLYREVANGGFRPDYRLLPLLGEGDTVVNVYRKERAISQPGGDVRWPSDVLPHLDLGLRHVRRRGLPQLGGHRPAHRTERDQRRMASRVGVDSASLADWLETWIAGTGWYEEDTDDEVRPWEAARQRLSEG